MQDEWVAILIAKNKPNMIKLNAARKKAEGGQVGQVGGKGVIQNMYLGENNGAIESASLDDVTIWVIWCWCDQNCICFYRIGCVCY